MEKTPYYLTELPQGRVGSFQSKGPGRILAPATNIRFGFRAPNPPDPGKPPTTEDKAVQEAAAAAAARRAKARGWRSTILSQNMMDAGSPALKSTFGS
jgi:hypothetical protein